MAQPQRGEDHGTASERHDREVITRRTCVSKEHLGISTACSFRLDLNTWDKMQGSLAVPYDASTPLPRPGRGMKLPGNVLGDKVAIESKDLL